MGTFWEPFGSHWASWAPLGAPWGVPGAPQGCFFGHRFFDQFFDALLTPFWCPNPSQMAGGPDKKIVSVLPSPDLYEQGPESSAVSSCSELTTHWESPVRLPSFCLFVVPLPFHVSFAVSRFLCVSASLSLCLCLSASLSLSLSLSISPSPCCVSAVTLLSPCCCLYAVSLPSLYCLSAVSLLSLFVSLLSLCPFP